MRERCLQLSDGKTDEVLQSDAALVGRQLGTGGREEGLVTGGGAPDHHHLAGLRLELKDELQGPGQVALDEGDRHRRLRVRRRRELLQARPGHDGNGWKQLLAVLADFRRMKSRRASRSSSALRKVSTCSVWMSRSEPNSCARRARMIRSTSALA